MDMVLHDCEAEGCTVKYASLQIRHQLFCGGFDSGFGVFDRKCSQEETYLEVGLSREEGDKAEQSQSVL